MAIEHTDRMGLPTYTSGTDLHPTREDFNSRMELIDQLAAIYQSGPHDERPLPSTPGIFYVCTDNRMLYVDTGTEWVDVRRLGHDGPGRAILVGETEGTEGTSDRAARADHTHPLKMATRDQPGALSASDKAILNTATSNATGGSLARRNGSGQLSTAAPSASGHATNRGYVDGEVGRVEDRAWLQQRTEPTNIDRLTTPGTYFSSNGATTMDGGFPTDGHGGVLNVYHAWDSRYVQQFIQWSSGRVWHRGTQDGGSNWHPWTELASTDRATSSSDGLMPSTDKRELDGATASADPNTLMRRNTQGNVSVASPAHPAHAANKGYVDDAVSDAVPEGTPVYRGVVTTHLDNLTSPGLYLSPESSAGAPISTSGEVQVTAHPTIPERVIQWYTSFNLNTVYHRTRHELTGWNSWQRLVTETV